MGETFYSVLGVDRDADTQTIKQAYREKVKDHHPDVSDAEDAEQIFKQLTDARDVLVDDSSRKQYDRVGHNEYVHRYLDSNAWSVNSGSAGTSTGGTGESGRSRSGTGSRSSRSGRSSSSRSGGSEGASNRRNRSSNRSTGSGRGSGNAEDYQRYRSGYSPDDEGSSGQQSTDSSGRAWTEDDFETSTSNASTTNSGRDTRQRGKKDQWQTAHAAANAYSPSGRDPAARRAQQTGLADVADAARQVGPWLAFHFVFLISAFITVWLFVSWTPSLPTMLVSVILLGFAIFFSILHMISRVYS